MSFDSSCKELVSALVLANMSQMNRPTRLDAGSECTVIRSGHKVFLKTLNGTVLDASNTVFDTGRLQRKRKTETDRAVKLKLINCLRWGSNQQPSVTCKLQANAVIFMPFALEGAPPYRLGKILSRCRVVSTLVWYSCDPDSILGQNYRSCFQRFSRALNKLMQLVYLQYDFLTKQFPIVVHFIAYCRSTFIETQTERQIGSH